MSDTLAAVTPLFSVLMPTYNRSALLPGVFENLAQLHGPSFELVIVDDGSTDDTATVLASLCETATFPVRKLSGDGRGLGAAVNLALDHAVGEFILLMDDDDHIRPNALQDALDVWNGIPVAARHQYGGVCGLCGDAGGAILGDSFPRDVEDSDFFTMRVVRRIRGDKKEIVRREAIGTNRVPVFVGERLGNSNFLWFHVARSKRTRFVNQAWMEKGRLPHGLSARMSTTRMANPNFQAEYHRRLLEWFPNGPVLFRLTSAKDFLRYRVHAGDSLRSAASKLDNRWLAALALPLAAIAVRADVAANASPAP